MIEIEESCGNVYRDIGLPDPDRMLIKAKIMTKISCLIRERKLTQQQAAKIVGIPQPKLSKMLNGGFRGVSEMKMLECLLRLGLNVQIVVGSEERDTEGQLDIVLT